MKRYILIILVIFFSIYMFGCGCGRKEADVEESGEFLSMEVLSTFDSEDTVSSESKTQVTSTASVMEINLEPLPPPGPYKPKVKEIQTALKNTGFYTGLIDGKAGPLTKKAIKEFQKAKGLKVDGVVGFKTWDILSNYLKSPVKSE